MARLVSVNVGMPKDVQWQGKTVHTGIWKTPVDGPVMVRRLNIDGDGQGDLAGHGGEQRAVMVYQTNAMTTGRATWDVTTCDRGTSGRTSRSTGSAIARSASATGTASARPNSRSPSRASPVSGSVCASANLRCPVYWSPIAVPGFYFRVITEGSVQAGDAIVRTRRGRHELSVADVDALLYLPDRNIDRLRKIVDVPALSPGWQQSFRDMLAAHESGVCANGSPDRSRARMDRIPATASDGHTPGKPDGAVDPARSRRSHRAAHTASRAVPHRQDPRRRRTGAAAQLLTIGRSRSGATTASA